MLDSSEPIARDDCQGSRPKVKITMVIEDADVPPQMQELLGFLADQGTYKAACLLSKMEVLERSGLEYSQLLSNLLALEGSFFKENVAVLASGLERSISQPLVNVQ